MYIKKKEPPRRFFTLHIACSVCLGLGSHHFGGLRQLVQLGEDVVTQQIRMREVLVAEFTSSIRDAGPQVLAVDPKACADPILCEWVFLGHADDRDGHLPVDGLLDHYTLTALVAGEAEATDSVRGEHLDRLQGLRVMGGLHSLPIGSCQLRAAVVLGSVSGTLCLGEVNFMCEVFAQEVEHLLLDLAAPAGKQVDLIRRLEQPGQRNEDIAAPEDAEDVGRFQVEGLDTVRVVHQLPGFVHVSDGVFAVDACDHVAVEGAHVLQLCLRADRRILAGLFGQRSGALRLLHQAGSFTVLVGAVGGGDGAFRLLRGHRFGGATLLGCLGLLFGWNLLARHLNLLRNVSARGGLKGSTRKSLGLAADNFHVL